MSLESAALRVNGATNRIYYRLTRRPHHFVLYSRLVTEAALRGRDILHLGAGAVSFADLCDGPLEDRRCIALEPDASTLARNPAKRRVVAVGERIPLPDASVDLVASEYVVEHLTEPEVVLRELRRVLRPGGRFVFVTPNFWSYSGLATHFTPHRAHHWFLTRLRKLGGSANQKPFPTAFRMNSMWTVRRLAAQTGFAMRELHTGVDHPTYTYPFPLIHQLAVLWHILLDKLPFLAPFRITLIGVLEVPSTPESGAGIRS